MNNMLIYKTASSVADVIAFYKDALAKSGSKLDGEPTEMGEVSMMNFVKDVQKLNLMVTVSEGGPGRAADCGMTPRQGTR